MGDLLFHGFNVAVKHRGVGGNAGPVYRFHNLQPAGGPDFVWKQGGANTIAHYLGTAAGHHRKACGFELLDDCIN